MVVEPFGHHRTRVTDRRADLVERRPPLEIPRDEAMPVQERAVKEFGLFGSENLIVFSP